MDVSESGAGSTCCIPTVYAFRSIELLGFRPAVARAIPHHHCSYSVSPP